MDTSKVIRGVVNSGRYTVTAPIVKEDYGLYLQIEGVELPSTYEVDFSNSENNGTSVTMIGNSDGVRIPRQFIDTGKDIFAFLYWVGEDYGKTVYKFRIPNKVRPDRTNEEPTPEEQSVIDQAISALNEAVEQTAEDRENADASAQSAYESADEAQQARDRAQGYANNAQTSATQASASAQASANSATASAQSASQSAQIKADVEGMVDDAQGYANSASQSASQASASEQGCARAVLDAVSAASIARARADEASGYAQTASTKASEAVGCVETATQKASESAQSASQALSYKNDAESAKGASQTAQGLAESARDTAVSAKTDAEQAKADAESARDEAQTIVDGISGALAEKAPVITDTASGSIASFSDGADDLPLKSLVVDINPIQDGTGDPSPDNVRPIGGWSEVVVGHNGVNVIPFPYINGNDVTINGVHWTVNADGTINAHGTANAQTYFYLFGVNSINPSVLKPLSALGLIAGETVTLTSNFPYLINIQTNKADGSFVWGAPTLDGGGIKTETIPLGCKYICIGLRVQNGITINMDNIYVQLQKGSTATPYEPYQGQQVTINLGQTVYGGKLDVLSGELTVDRAMVDLGTLSWNRSNNNGVWSHYLFYTNIQTQTLRKSYMCSVYPIASLANVTQSPTDKAIYGLTSNTYIYIRDDSYSDVTAFKSAVTGQTLVYKLSNPITIQLTPNQVNSLLGVNNIWADSGDTEVVYRADTKAYIAKKIAEAIASLT